MLIDIASGIAIPFLGTTLGAACVFLLKRELKLSLQKGLIGFAAGVMTAASIWSLLIPAIQETTGEGLIKVGPAFLGFWLGIIALLVIDKATPHLHRFTSRPEGPATHLKSSTLLLLAVTIHNIPEGMAVGVVFAGALFGNDGITLSSALALSLGIAIQNFPEGAIISMPLCGRGLSKAKAFAGGVFSGAVEPIAAVLVLMTAQTAVGMMPYFLSFAAGAMLYVVVEELIPEMSSGQHSHFGVLSFALGFSLMMVLDLVLG
ncbi:MAG: ZIP family metal transporter [Eggerthellaceae bacterium]|jgi:ZIP family zinc transporter